MPHFIFCVKDENGRSLHGVIEAENKAEVKRRVRYDDYFLVSANLCRKESVFDRRVPFQTLTMFTHRMMSMIEAGIPILAVMKILWRQTEDPTIQIVVSHMKFHLEEGGQMSSAMDAFPNIFPPVYRSLVRVGEMSGALVKILRKLSEYLEYQAKMIDRTKRATMYPCFVIVFSILVILGMFAFVVPTFQKVLLKLHVALPLLTQVVLAFSNTIRSPWVIAGAVAALFLGIGALKMIKKNDRMGYWVDKTIMKIPYFGELLYIFCLSQVVRSLSILLGAGVPILESLRVASTTAGNKKTTADLNLITAKIESGVSLYDAFRSVKDFPVMLVEMVGIGESSGMLVDVLEKVTRHFDEEVDYQINRFLTILEPMLIITVGVIVVITLLAIYLPVVNIWQGLMNH